MIETTSKVKKHLMIRPVVTGNDILGFGEYIHASLTGNQDYIYSKIVVHLHGYNENEDHRVDAIEVIMFEDCESYPVIIKMLEDIRELTTSEGVEIFIEVSDGSDLNVSIELND